MGKTLYLGLDPSRYPTTREVVHCPLLRIVPLHPLRMPPRPTHAYTHLIFTSREAVKIWSRIDPPPWPHTLLAVGSATALALPAPALIAPQATQEGMAQLISSLPTSNPILLWPRSQGARSFLETFLQHQNIQCDPINLYETVTRVPHPLPNLEEYEELVLTSPSCVRAFFDLFGPPPAHILCTTIGPITAQELSKNRMRNSESNHVKRDLLALEPQLPSQLSIENDRCIAATDSASKIFAFHTKH